MAELQTQADLDGTISVLAHSLLGTVAVIAGEISLLARPELDGTLRERLAERAVDAVDLVAEALRRLAGGAPAAALVVASGDVRGLASSGGRR